MTTTDDFRLVVVNAAQLRSALKDVGDDLSDMTAASEKVSNYIARRAVQTAPRRTGRLAATGKGSRSAGRASVTFGSSSVQYARVVHWGWRARHIRRNPWVSRAALQTQQVWLKDYQADVEEIVTRNRMAD